MRGTDWARWPNTSSIEHQVDNQHVLLMPSTCFTVTGLFEIRINHKASRQHSISYGRDIRNPMWALAIAAHAVWAERPKACQASQFVFNASTSITPSRRRRWPGPLLSTPLNFKRVLTFVVASRWCHQASGELKFLSFVPGKGKPQRMVSTPLCNCNSFGHFRLTNVDFSKGQLVVDRGRGYMTSLESWALFSLTA